MILLHLVYGGCRPRDGSPATTEREIKMLYPQISTVTQITHKLGQVHSPAAGCSKRG